MKKTFGKQLSSNDVGATGAHQAGVHIPKSETELLALLPPLDRAVKNPDAWIECIDELGATRRFRFVYYNNKLHDPKGTRNEYRLTYMTAYFRDIGAKAGDKFEITCREDRALYEIKVTPSRDNQLAQSVGPVRVKITSGWHRQH